ncbi:hypothetical protein ANN_10849 [Periplaneta americana]|uniref:DUF4817 domain-containing protein n=1 Tax=Periplaneta americana TaxID=6978 RepID=A0ABQ8T5P8_PERAM|nr:hypothetical protein ANN_10849 [Periplaneta americana]
MGKAHPSLYHVLEQLQLEVEEVDRCIERLEGGHSPTKKKWKYIDMDRRISRIVEEYLRYKVHTSKLIAFEGNAVMFVPVDTLIVIRLQCSKCYEVVQHRVEEFPILDAVVDFLKTTGHLLLFAGTGSGELVGDACESYLLCPTLALHKLKEVVQARSLPSKETLRGHSDSSFRGEGYIQCCVGVRLCDMYSNQELAEIHFMYGKADGNPALARRLYQESYPQRQCPDRKTFVHLQGRPRSTTPEVQEEILEAVNLTSSISTRRVALQVNVPHTTVWRLLKEYQLYLYHLQRVQALSPADYPAGVRFCQWFLQQCGVNPNFPALVLFTGEAQFTRDGITNFHNQHVWAYENPRATVPSLHQVRFSLNMWAGIIGDRLVGPHVLVNRLTDGAGVHKLPGKHHTSCFRRQSSTHSFLA